MRFLLWWITTPTLNSPENVDAHLRHIERAKSMRQGLCTAEASHTAAGGLARSTLV